MSPGPCLHGDGSRLPVIVPVPGPEAACDRPPDQPRPVHMVSGTEGLCDEAEEVILQLGDEMLHVWDPGHN